MAETKHTPGPWVVIPAREYEGDDDELVGSYTSPAGIEGSNGDPVCVFGTAEGSGHLFENEADYRLIAAAPDLLEALRDCLDRFVEAFPTASEYEPIKSGFAAISKAEGR